MSAYTPGPWKADQSGDIFVPASKQGIGEVWHNLDEWEANARLISAAPELLEALRILIEVMDTGMYDAEVFERGRAAIDKATKP